MVARKRWRFGRTSRFSEHLFFPNASPIPHSLRSALHHVFRKWDEDSLELQDSQDRLAILFHLHSGHHFASTYHWCVHFAHPRNSAGLQNLRLLHLLQLSVYHEASALDNVRKSPRSLHCSHLSLPGRLLFQLAVLLSDFPIVLGNPVFVYRCNGSHKKPLQSLCWPHSTILCLCCGRHCPASQVDPKLYGLQAGLVANFSSGQNKIRGGPNYEARRKTQPEEACEKYSDESVQVQIPRGQPRVDHFEYCANIGWQAILGGCWSRI